MASGDVVVVSPPEVGPDLDPACLGPAQQRPRRRDCRRPDHRPTREIEHRHLAARRVVDDSDLGLVGARGRNEDPPVVDRAALDPAPLVQQLLAVRGHRRPRLDRARCRRDRLGPARGPEHPAPADRHRVRLAVRGGVPHSHRAGARVSDQLDRDPLASRALLLAGRDAVEERADMCVAARVGPRIDRAPVIHLPGLVERAHRTQPTPAATRLVGGELEQAEIEPDQDPAALRHPSEHHGVRPVDHRVVLEMDGGGCPDHVGHRGGDRCDRRDVLPDREHPPGGGVEDQDPLARRVVRHAEHRGVRLAGDVGSNSCGLFEDERVVPSE